MLEAQLADPELKLSRRETTEIMEIAPPCGLSPVMSSDLKATTSVLAMTPVVTLPTMGNSTQAMAAHGNRTNGDAHVLIEMKCDAENDAAENITRVLTL